MADLLSGFSGALVGFILALVGGGGSVLAMPLLVYGVGGTSAHVAIGTSALAVSASALANLLGHAKAGHVKWRCGLVFAAAGVTGALIGSTFAKTIDGQKLLALFGGLMVLVGMVMFLKRAAGGDPTVRLDRSSASVLLPWLSGFGFATGLLSGFFGIGGGFLIVPALMLATGMSLPFAIGTSLISVTGFGAATAASYAMSGLVDWRIALAFIVGGVAGGLGGIALGRRLAERKGALGILLASVIVLVGVYVIAQNVV
ncbi:MAG: sulfite exporter TauE/SafE family protein [Hyphomicrobiales bacterium]|nr:sulfite exporter TauE/SafE family protein [Hyphomicrobiales bacterium]